MRVTALRQSAEVSLEQGRLEASGRETEESTVRVFGNVLQAARLHRLRRRVLFPHMPLSNPGSRYSRVPTAHHPVDTGPRSMVNAAA